MVKIGRPKMKAENKLIRLTISIDRKSRDRVVKFAQDTIQSVSSVIRKLIKNNIGE